MKKFLCLIKSAVAGFCVSLTLTTASVHADDIEIYASANSAGPPVNVMFIFDLSASMLWTPDGNENPAPGELTRKDILLDALTNVLENNKDKENLRVGFNWFNSYGRGISYPVTSIGADLHDLDPNVPANTHYVYSQIPKELDEIWLGSGAHTNIVDGIFRASLYFRGKKVWWSPRPPEWNNYNGTYDRNESAHPLSYTPEPGPEAWEIKPAVGTEATCDEDLSAQSTCKPGYSDSYKRRVYDCDAHEETVCHPYSCVNNGEDQVCTCHNPTLQSKRSCKYDYNYNDYEWLGARYNSPIEDSCQASYIVLLSDGEPTENIRRDYVEEHVLNKSCATLPNLSSGECGPELVEFLANNDQIPSIIGSTVKTYTIGFNVEGAGKTYLETLAEKGQGVFYPASDASDLEAAFEQIINSITAENESFSSLVTTIRASTLSSDNRVFLNMFKPENTRSWKGNTKGYFIDHEGLRDVDGNLAVTINDENVDKFTDLARSFWSNGPDGNFVELGGASMEIERDNSRTIYTYTDTVTPNRSALTELSLNETDITPQLLGVPDETTKNEIINWLHNDVGMGDPLHAKPVLITYENGAGVKRDVLFAMTNQGLVHAIDTTEPSSFGDYSGGNEIFSFIPQALLPQLKDHKANLKSSAHLYGLDGAITYYHEDTNHDRIVNDSEKIYLYFGMRRGGKNYYALDISNLSSPSLQWRIEGGTGDFTQLAQTWSALTPVNIKWTGGETKTALIFGGGYDEAQDNHLIKTEDTIGNAIYIVDAESGEPLWSATKGDSSIDSHQQMKYSIPSDIRVIDTDKDRHVDRLYFGDMGGQVWRIDLVDSDKNKSISGYRLADFSPLNEQVNTRRFFSPPSIAKLKNASGYHYTVAIGSGFRAHPNSPTVDDRIFMLRDTNIETGPPTTSWTAITSLQLLNITDDAIGQGNEQAITDLSDMDGWFLDLEDLGEKSLTPLLTMDGNLTFTTFTPADSGDGSLTCGGGGTGRYYLFKLSDATPVKNFYDDDSPKTRSKTLSGNGIPTEVSSYTSPLTVGEPLPKSRMIVGKVMTDEKTELLYDLNWKKIE